VRSGPRAVRAGGILDSRRGAAIRWRQLRWTLSDASSSSIRGPIRTCPRTLDVRLASPYSAGRAFPGSDPTSDVPCRSQAPSPRLQSERPADRARRYRSCGFDLRSRTALRTPGEERTLERSRTPSVVSGPDAFVTRRPSTPWRPLKDATRRFAHRFALARADARAQRDADLPRARHSRFPREHRDVSDRLLPTTACLTCTRALGFRPAWSALASGAIEGSVVSRRAGPASAGRAATRRFVSPSRRVAGVFSTPEPRTLSRCLTRLRL